MNEKQLSQSKPRDPWGVTIDENTWGVGKVRKNIIYHLHALKGNLMQLSTEEKNFILVDRDQSTQLIREALSWGATQLTALGLQQLSQERKSTPAASPSQLYPFPSTILDEITIIEKGVDAFCNAFIRQFDFIPDREDDSQSRSAAVLTFPNLTMNPLKKRRRKLPPDSTSILKKWFTEHIDDPYPSDEIKHKLAKESNLTHRQVTTWFINTRKRVWQPYRDKGWRGRANTGNEPPSVLAESAVYFAPDDYIKMSDTHVSQQGLQNLDGLPHGLFPSGDEQVMGHTQQLPASMPGIKRRYQQTLCSDSIDPSPDKPGDQRQVQPLKYEPKLKRQRRQATIVPASSAHADGSHRQQVVSISQNRKDSDAQAEEAKAQLVSPSLASKADSPSTTTAAFLSQSRGMGNIFPESVDSTSPLLNDSNSEYDLTNNTSAISPLWSEGLSSVAPNDSQGALPHAGSLEQFPYSPLNSPVIGTGDLNDWNRQQSPLLDHTSALGNGFPGSAEGPSSTPLLQSTLGAAGSESPVLSSSPFVIGGSMLKVPEWLLASSSAEVAGPELSPRELDADKPMEGGDLSRQPCDSLANTQFGGMDNSAGEQKLATPYPYSHARSQHGLFALQRLCPGQSVTQGEDDNHDQTMDCR